MQQGIYRSKWRGLHGLPCWQIQGCHCATYRPMYRLCPRKISARPRQAVLLRVSPRHHIFESCDIGRRLCGTIETSVLSNPVDQKSNEKQIVAVGGSGCYRATLCISCKQHKRTRKKLLIQESLRYCSNIFDLCAGPEHQKAWLFAEDDRGKRHVHAAAAGPLSNCTVRQTFSASVIIKKVLFVLSISAYPHQDRFQILSAP